MNQRLLQWILVLLLFSPAMFAQLPGSGHTTPSVSDDNTPNNRSNHHQMSSKDVAVNLQKYLDSKNAAYAGSKIQAIVDDQSITLSGTVTSQSQHEMAMQLAKAYARQSTHYRSPCYPAVKGALALAANGSACHEHPG